MVMLRLDRGYVEVLLTDGGEDTGETKVVDCVEGEQVKQELLLLLLTAQEGVALIQLPGNATTHINHGFDTVDVNNIVCLCVRAYLVKAWRDSNRLRCCESSFFSRERRIQALALPTSVFISPILWMCLRTGRREAWGCEREGEEVRTKKYMFF